MSDTSPKKLPPTHLLASVVLCFSAALPIQAVGLEATRACPSSVDGTTAASQESQSAVRRLRDAVPTDQQGAGAESDLAEMAFVASTRPNPAIEKIVQVPLEEGRTRLRITVRNNSRHASPDGGITLSFPGLTRPDDDIRIAGVDVPEGMALHIIPAGGSLFGRSGLEQVAEHLMIEIHGAWQQRQARTLALDVLQTQLPVAVQYRSALSDENGDYFNTPTESVVADQQGWPAFSCALGGSLPTVAAEDRSTAQVPVRGDSQ